MRMIFYQTFDNFMIIKIKKSKLLMTVLILTLNNHIQLSKSFIKSFDGIITVFLLIFKPWRTRYVRATTDHAPDN